MALSCFFLKNVQEMTLGFNASTVCILKILSKLSSVNQRVYEQCHRVESNIMNLYNVNYTKCENLQLRLLRNPCVTDHTFLRLY